MHRLHTTMLLATSVAALTGCGAFSSPRESPVIEERVTDFGLRKIGILATTAERRAVIVKVPERLLCAEPPPDVGEAVAAAFSAYLQAEGSKLPVEAKGGVARASGTSIAQLTYRTQGLQLYRDGSFFLCNMYMNGVIKDKEYEVARKDLLAASIELIKQEIPSIAAIKKEAATTVTPPDVASSTPGGAASAAPPASAPR
jgi:hypothetical protein